MVTLDYIREIDERLGDWLLESRPTTEPEREQAKRVLFLLNRLDRLRHELILEDFKLIALDLKEPTEKLQALNEGISKTAKHISTADEVIGIASSTISVVAGIIAFLA
jgi:chromosome segregation ATPase